MSTSPMPARSSAWYSHHFEAAGALAVRARCSAAGVELCFGPSSSPGTTTLSLRRRPGTSGVLELELGFSEIVRVLISAGMTSAQVVGALCQAVTAAGFDAAATSPHTLRLSRPHL